jgi:uncharacterized membrane protein
LPSYSFRKALFPKEVPIPTRTKELDNMKRIALSIGMSIALVPIAGLLLNYTPWGIRATLITLSLLTLSIVFTTASVTRKNYVLSPTAKQKTVMKPAYRLKRLRGF